MTFCASRYFTAVLLVFLAGFLILPSSKAVNNFFYAFLLLPAVLLLVGFKAPRPHLSFLSALWLSFFCWLALTGLWGGDVKFFKYLFYTLVFCLIVWLWVSWQSFDKVYLFQLFFWGLIVYVTASALFFWLTGQIAFGVRVLSLPSRLEGPILTSILIVSCFALLLPEWLRDRCWLSISAATTATLFCVGFVLQSRSGLVGLGVLLAVALGQAAWVGEWRLRIAVVVVSALLVLVFLWLFHDSKVVASLITRADSGRFELWQLYLQEWIGCGLLLGCGPGYSPEILIERGILIQHPHNIFLAIGFRYGIPGVLLFTAVMIATLWQAWEQKNAWGAYLFIALLMFNFDGRELIDSPHEVWLLVLLPAMLIAARQQRSGEKRGSNPHSTSPKET